MSTVLNAMSGLTGTTWNGAISNSTTSFDKFGACLDYFTKAGTYTNRSTEEVNASMSKIFADDEKTALAILFGLRLITRTPKVEGTEFEDSQTGYGRRDEFYKGVLWLKNNKPDLLYLNLDLIPVFGSWKDFLNEPLVDALDTQKVYQLFSDNLDNQLVRKYLPQIRSQKKARSDRDRKRIAWAKGFCDFLNINHKEYRKLKSEGTAHIWQKQMCRREWDSINFNGIPGKAMHLHSTLKGKDKQNVFDRHNLTKKLTDWVLSQPMVKFTGYPYELAKVAMSNPALVQKLIADKQAETMIESMRNHSLGNVMTAIDTSGSMQSFVAGKTTAYDICISMGAVFSMLNVGYFKDSVVSFDSTSRVFKVNGSFCDRIQQLCSMTTAWGSTNFESVIKLIVDTRQKHPEIPVSDYPETLLVISDMQFNPVGGNTETNYVNAMKKLHSVGLGDMRIIWWFVNGKGTDFPSQMSDKGVYMIGGFDPVNLKALMGLNSKTKNFDASAKKEQTPLDGMKNFLSQPIFDLLKFEEASKKTSPKKKPVKKKIIKKKASSVKPVKKKKK